MSPKPGDVYRVDLGMGGKVRLMLVVSREDALAPRALSICAPITTACRGSAYEVELPPRPFLRERSYANLQGLQAIQHHELQGPVGVFHGRVMDRIREAIAFTFDIKPPEMPTDGR
ncbi:MAG: type II toxin-antitoxin system PemK/MazF family toxin [Akkermansiaceae bacterium]|jgi:mRNA-degrading endonuclease toxin of MazEF toxin-antitoxin module|nr:type II toxin-antitoxin system PemK/MazF family toxin [Akkermansiaceae bacterium]MCU0776975.1 type II toxin-antitoxin system PemK/MazF family toxin [Akkermansiaceae bacterium]